MNCFALVTPYHRNEKKKNIITFCQLVIVVWGVQITNPSTILSLYVSVFGNEFLNIFDFGDFFTIF